MNSFSIYKKYFHCRFYFYILHQHLLGVNQNLSPNGKIFEILFLQGKAASKMFHPMSKFTDMLVVIYVLTLNNHIGVVRARLKCGRLWVRAPIRSKQRL